MRETNLVRSFFFFLCWIIIQHSNGYLMAQLYLLDVLEVLEDGDLQTLGLLDYDKRLKHAFTAHPKVDPITGERIESVMFLFCFF